MEVSGKFHAPAVLPPGNEPMVPIRWEAGWAPKPHATYCYETSSTCGSV